MIESTIYVKIHWQIKSMGQKNRTSERGYLYKVLETKSFLVRESHNRSDRNRMLNRCVINITC